MNEMEEEELVAFHGVIMMEEEEKIGSKVRIKSCSLALGGRDFHGFVSFHIVIPS